MQRIVAGVLSRRRLTRREAMPNSSMYTKSAVLNWKVTFSSWAPYCMLHGLPTLMRSLPL